MYIVLRGIMRALVATILRRRRVHVTGLQNIPARGGALLVSNHVGTIDPPLTGALIARTDTHYMAKSEHFARRRVRWLFRGYHAFPVVRGSADRAALRHALALLADGHLVLVYPEGSRSPDGRLRAAQPGVGFLARHARVPVIPVAVWGTETVVPRGTWRIHPGDVHVAFGSAVTLPAVEAPPRADHRAVAAAVMAAIATMLPDRYRPAGEADTTAA